MRKKIIRLLLMLFILEIFAMTGYMGENLKNFAYIIAWFTVYAINEYGIIVLIFLVVGMTILHLKKLKKKNEKIKEKKKEEVE